MDKAASHKEQALIVHLRPLKDTSIALYKNNKPITSYTPSWASFLGPFSGSSNPGPLSATSQVPKYSKDDFQRIFITVLEAKASILKSFDKL